MAARPLTHGAALQTDALPCPVGLVLKRTMPSPAILCTAVVADVGQYLVAVGHGGHAIDRPKLVRLCRIAAGVRQLPPQRERACRSAQGPDGLRLGIVGLASRGYFVMTVTSSDVMGSDVVAWRLHVEFDARCGAQAEDVLARLRRAQELSLATYTAATALRAGDDGQSQGFSPLVAALPEFAAFGQGWLDSPQSSVEGLHRAMGHAVQSGGLRGLYLVDPDKPSSALLAFEEWLAPADGGAQSDPREPAYFPAVWAAVRGAL